MIYVNQEEQSFHLTNGKISYIFRVMEKTKVLEQLYFGAAIPHYDSFDFLIEREIRPGNNQGDGNLTTSLEHIKQELPVYGTTDFRYPALHLRYPEGDTITKFTFDRYEIKRGKQKTPGLPTTFGTMAQVEVLIIYLKDRYSKLELALHYAIFNDYPIITRQQKLINHDSTSYQIERLMSLNVDLPAADYDWLHLSGAWARETQVNREKLFTGIQQISSTRGASSHIHNPFFALCSPNATEHQGEVYGFSLIYSGNFLAQIEVDSYQVTRIQMGINPFEFQWELKAGSSFMTPEAVMCYSQTGFNGMSQNFHEFFKNHLIRSQWLHRKRPVLINNWEATYFDFNEKKILELAKTASELGIDLLVLDDGWFGQRDDDCSSLGDWFVDLRKIPNGLPHLSKQIHQLGLKFGLWFEPEMISKNTKLYKTHPDWLIGHPKKELSHGRNQFVLDFSRPEVVEAIYQQMASILSTTEIDYLKWDMNRYISEAFSQKLSAGNQGELFHRYVLGVYDLYERLLADYPELLIESCAGGGGRFDPGLLYYAPQTWASDDTDALERLKIQYGASMVYPLSSIGSHVSEVPNHQVGRITSLAMRGDVASFGTFGYELDITSLTKEEHQLLKRQIKTFKSHQELIHNGLFYRLNSPYEKNLVAWMVVAKDQKEALVGVYHQLAKPNPAYQRVLLKGLNPQGKYQINQLDPSRFGQDLMQIGLLLNENYLGRESDYWQRDMPGDFSSTLYHLRQQN